MTATIIQSIKFFSLRCTSLNCIQLSKGAFIFIFSFLCVYNILEFGLFIFISLQSNYYNCQILQLNCPDNFYLLLLEWYGTEIAHRAEPRSRFGQRRLFRDYSQPFVCSNCELAGLHSSTIRLL